MQLQSTSLRGLCVTIWLILIALAGTTCDEPERESAADDTTALRSYFELLAQANEEQRLRASMLPVTPISSPEDSIAWLTPYSSNIKQYLSDLRTLSPPRLVGDTHNSLVLRLAQQLEVDQRIIARGPAVADATAFAESKESLDLQILARSDCLDLQRMADELDLDADLHCRQLLVPEPTLVAD